MAVTQTQQLPAPFLGDITKNYAQRLGQVTAPELVTSEFAPKVAPQDPYQTDSLWSECQEALALINLTSLAQAQRVSHRAQHRWGKQQQQL